MSHRSGGNKQIDRTATAGLAARGRDRRRNPTVCPSGVDIECDGVKSGFDVLEKLLSRGSLGCIRRDGWAGCQFRECDGADGMHRWQGRRVETPQVDHDRGVEQSDRGLRRFKHEARGLGR